MQNSCSRTRNRLRNRRAVQKWKRANSRAARAHRTVARAISKGELQRLPCEVCGEPKSEAHHDDYSDALNVRWLCRKHHKEHHRKARLIQQVLKFPRPRREVEP